MNHIPPWKINMESKTGGLIHLIFLFKIGDFWGYMLVFTGGIQD